MITPGLQYYIGSQNPQRLKISPPGRPIIASIGSILQLIAIYLDVFFAEDCQRLTLLLEGHK